MSSVAYRICDGATSRKKSGILSYELVCRIIHALANAATLALHVSLV